jgi:tryptophanyl-tRNA synthetase
LRQSLFKSGRDCQEFRRSCTEEITPELENLREARRQSEEQSKKHRM